MDLVKDAFKKVKEDIEFLFQEINDLKRTLLEINSKLPTPTPKQDNPTLNSNTPTLQHHLEAPNNNIIDISTGNDGVPTIQPTNQPTIQHPPISTGKDKLSELQRVTEIIGSLDSMKKEIRVKIKKLTEKEMQVYSLIYNLEDQGFIVDYSLISQQLQLSEISIRDYIRKINKKGLPLIKQKVENNKVILSIPQEFKRLASLDTLITLREL